MSVLLQQAGELGLTIAAGKLGESRFHLYGGAEWLGLQRGLLVHDHVPGVEASPRGALQCSNHHLPEEDVQLVR